MNVDREKVIDNNIVIEAMALVLSGKLEDIKDDE